MSPINYWALLVGLSALPLSAYEWTVPSNISTDYHPGIKHARGVPNESRAGEWFSESGLSSSPSIQTRALEYSALERVETNSFRSRCEPGALGSESKSKKAAPQ